MKGKHKGGRAKVTDHHRKQTGPPSGTNYTSARPPKVRTASNRKLPRGNM